MSCSRHDNALDQQLQFSRCAAKVGYSFQAAVDLPRCRIFFIIHESSSIVGATALPLDFFESNNVPFLLHNFNAQMEAAKEDHHHSRRRWLFLWPVDPT